MKIAGANSLPYPREQVWDALLDPSVLVATIPGCERLEATGDNSYAMTVTAGVAAIRGTYSGTCTLSDLAPHDSLVMRLSGAGAPGTVDATVDVSFAEADGGTTVSWSADATVGGMVGGVGQRMLGSVSKRMAGEFFDNVGRAIGGASTVAAAAPAGGAGVAGATAGAGGAGGAGVVGGAGQVFTAPARPGLSSRDDFVKGIAVGAGLVLLGVVAGSVFGRRR